ncbi:MAG: hypothetical protein HN337_04600 [Deltaproteobacteria bacterium]|jgi:hypothetical protein|nr:hypothetical protein [Deltaproteobacteria bacterium]
MGWEACQTIVGTKDHCRFNRQVGEQFCVDEKRTAEVCKDFKSKPTLEDAAKALSSDVARTKREFKKVTSTSKPVVSRTFSWADFFSTNHSNHHCIFQRTTLP